MIGKDIITLTPIFCNSMEPNPEFGEIKNDFNFWILSGWKCFLLRFKIVLHVCQCFVSILHIRSWHTFYKWLRDWKYDLKKKCVKLEVCGLELMNESQNGVHWRSLCRIYKGFIRIGEYIVGNFSIVFAGIREYKE